MDERMSQQLKINWLLNMADEAASALKTEPIPSLAVQFALQKLRAIRASATLMEILESPKAEREES